MRVSREKVMENRRTILDAAGWLLRERGFEAVTVAEIMQAAGLRPTAWRWMQPSPRTCGFWSVNLF